MMLYRQNNGPEYSPKHPVLKLPQSVFLLNEETNCHTRTKLRGL
jgi:hypothetical protein